MRQMTAILVICSVFGLSGCATQEKIPRPKTVPASGIVTLDGTPVDKASVMFIATAGNNHATGTTDSSGKFVLKAFPEKDGAVPGAYKVEVNKTLVTSLGADGDEGTVKVEYGLPIKYATNITSGLTATIPEAGTSGLKLELKSK